MLAHGLPEMMANLKNIDVQGFSGAGKKRHGKGFSSFFFPTTPFAMAMVGAAPPFFAAPISPTLPPLFPTQQLSSRPLLFLRRPPPSSPIPACPGGGILPRATSKDAAPSPSEALEAVAEVLMEAGLGEGEAARIASSSPRYLGMLVEGVRELDEGSLWGCWGGGGGELSLKAKVKYMAREKGDRGMIAFLESLGLSPSSLLHIARYLSSQNLPDIVAKVGWVNNWI